MSMAEKDRGRSQILESMAEFSLCGQQILAARLQVVLSIQSSLIGHPGTKLCPVHEREPPRETLQ